MSSSDPDFVAKGRNGQVELYPEKIAITRKGIVAKLSHWGSGRKELRFDDITGIQFKSAGWAFNGYIQFGQSGYSESDGGSLEAANDENSVTFSRGQEADFEELKERIDQRRNHETGHQSNGNPAIQKLREQYAEGEIDRETFEERRSVLEDN